MLNGSKSGGSSFPLRNVTIVGSTSPVGVSRNARHELCRNSICCSMYGDNGVEGGVRINGELFCLGFGLFLNIGTDISE